jgi:hypothetical protein
MHTRVIETDSIITEANAKQSNLHTNTEGKKYFGMYKNEAVFEKQPRQLIGLNSVNNV